jgi:hypothetical protein
MNLAPSILRSLSLMSGKPQTTQALIDSVRLVHRGIPDGEIRQEIQRCQALGMIFGTRNELLDTDVWTLTDKGDHAASQL